METEAARGLNCAGDWALAVRTGFLPEDFVEAPPVFRVKRDASLKRLPLPFRRTEFLLEEPYFSPAPRVVDSELPITKKKSHVPFFRSRVLP